MDCTPLSASTNLSSYIATIPDKVIKYFRKFSWHMAYYIIIDFHCHCIIICRVRLILHFCLEFISYGWSPIVHVHMIASDNVSKGIDTWRRHRSLSHSSCLPVKPSNFVKNNYWFPEIIFLHPKIRFINCHSQIYYAEFLEELR